LADGGVLPQKASKTELDRLRGAIERNLRDAALPDLSADNKFGMAYEAALLTAKMAVAVAGYRVRGQAAHATTFVALGLAMGPAAGQRADYFDRCRRKRNALSYEYSGAATDAEAAEILEAAKKFRAEVEDWIATRRPDLGA
jgi:hypothetical protein